MTLPLLTVVLRLGLAVLFGVVVGLEREATPRGAGMRTHALVSLGAAVFTLAGAYGFADLEVQGGVDPSRVAAQVATGVGFIGAGAIIRHGTSVAGVTTAATVWLAAAVGVAAAAGGFTAGAVATALALAVLVVMRAARPVTRRIGAQRTLLELEYERGHGTLGPLLRAVDGLDGQVQKLSIEDDGPDDGGGIRHVVLHVLIRDAQAIDHLVANLEARPEVRLVRVGTAD